MSIHSLSLILSHLLVIFGSCQLLKCLSPAKSCCIQLNTAEYSLTSPVLQADPPVFDSYRIEYSFHLTPLCTRKSLRPSLWKVSKPHYLLWHTDQDDEWAHPGLPGSFQTQLATLARALSRPWKTGSISREKNNTGGNTSHEWETTGDKMS